MWKACGRECCGKWHGKQVTEKCRFPRHLPVNRKQEYRREGAVKVLQQKAWREGAGQMPLLSAPSGQGSGSGPAREASETGRFITKSRRWWRNAIFPGTFQSTKIRITDGKEVVKRAEKKKSGQPCRYPDFFLCVVLSRNAPTAERGTRRQMPGWRRARGTRRESWCGRRRRVRWTSR